MRRRVTFPWLGWQSLADGQKVAVILAGLLLLYGGLVFGVLPRHVFFVGDEGMKFVLAASVAQRQDLWHVAFEYPGREVDPEMRFFPYSWWMWARKGEAVPKYLSALTFLNAPLYSLLGISGSYVVPLLSGLGIAWLAYCLARLAGTRHAWVVALLAGLSTPVFWYSLTTWDHTPSVLLSTLVIYLMARQAIVPRWWEMALAGFAMGLGLWMRYEMFLLAGTVILAYAYVFRSEKRLWRGLIPFALGLGAVIVAMVAQQYTVYGRLNDNAIWLRASTLNTAKQGASSVLDAWQKALFFQAEVVLAMSVDGSAFWLERVFLALALVATVLAYRLDALRRRPLVVLGSALMLGAGVALAFIHRRLATVTGLVPTLPLTALGLVHFPVERSGQRVSSCLVLDLVVTVSVVFLCLGLFLVPYTPGYSWGPRYLAPLFPLIPVTAWATFQRSTSAQQRARHRWAGYAAFILLACLGIVAQCVGVSILYDKKQEMSALYDGTRALDTLYVLSDQDWYLAEMASLYLERYMFLAHSQEDYEALVERLYQHGVDRFAWVWATTTAIDPLVRTESFAVRNIDGILYEIVGADSCAACS